MQLLTYFNIWPTIIILDYNIFTIKWYIFNKSVSGIVFNSYLKRCNFHCKKILPKRLIINTKKLAKAEYSGLRYGSNALHHFCFLRLRQVLGIRPTGIMTSIIKPSTVSQYFIMFKRGKTSKNKWNAITLSVSINVWTNWICQSKICH